MSELASRQPRPFLVTLGFLIVAGIGIVDYLTGHEISVAIFYLLAIFWAGWCAGWRFGLVISASSAGALLLSNLAGAQNYSHPFIPYWNAVLWFGVFGVIVWLQHRLRAVNRNLEQLVQERTAALRAEIAERQRLEQEILEISDQERKRIGRDLHDGLCQHLISAALACTLLEQKLRENQFVTVNDAQAVLALLNEGISQTRSLTHLLYPVELEQFGLASALEQMALQVQRCSGVHCRFNGDPSVQVGDGAAATHLYRIAQEAVQNAIKHGRPNQVEIRLATTNGAMALTVEDDGIGIPDGLSPIDGIGLHTMAYRASVLGGSLEVRPGGNSGTVVSCTLPRPCNSEG